MEKGAQPPQNPRNKNSGENRFGQKLKRGKDSSEGSTSQKGNAKDGWIERGNSLVRLKLGERLRAMKRQNRVSQRSGHSESGARKQTSR